MGDAIAPKDVIFYPEENTVRLIFSSETASLEEQYSIKPKGICTIDGNAIDMSENKYLANYIDAPAGEFSVMSLSVTDASGRSIGFANKAGYYTVKLMYTNPGGAASKKVTVKNNDEVLCDFDITARAGEVRTLTRSVFINKGTMLSLDNTID